MNARMPNAPRKTGDNRPMLVTAILIAVSLGLLVEQVSTPVCFLVGALFIVSALWFAQFGRGWLGLTVGALLSGVAIFSVGIARYVTAQPVQRNPVRDRPALYYASWLQVQRQRCARQLRPGQSLALDFLPGPENHLTLTTRNIPPDQQKELAGQIQQDFTSAYPSAPFHIEVSE